MRNTTKPLYVRLYTDASKCEKMTTAVSIVVGRKTFIGKVITVSEGLDSASTEFLAIKQGLEYIRTLNLNIARLDIYTDVLPFKTNYYRTKKGEVFVSKYDFKYLLELTDGIETDMHYFTAHQESNNLNKSCDILARSHSKLASKGVI